MKLYNFYIKNELNKQTKNDVKRSPCFALYLSHLLPHPISKSRQHKSNYLSALDGQKNNNNDIANESINIDE